jgi:regulator of PEP synthase PpsR (kinase-PPPase family)
MIDHLGELRRIMNMNAAETYDRTTDSLEAIANAIATHIGLVSVPGTHAHANNIGEQVAITIPAPANVSVVETIYLDLVNLTQNADIRIYYQIDGANYRVIETFNWTVGMDDGVYFRNIGISNPVQVTVQSTALEGAVRDIPWEYILRG